MTSIIYVVAFGFTIKKNPQLCHTTKIVKKKGGVPKQALSFYFLNHFIIYKNLII